jgi:hypothetical protein
MRCQDVVLLVIAMLLVDGLAGGCSKSPTRPEPPPPPPRPDLIPVAVPGGFSSPLRCGYNTVIIPTGSIVINNQGNAAANPPVKVVLGITAASDTSGRTYVPVQTWDDYTGGIRWGPDSLWYSGSFSFPLPPCYRLGAGTYRWIVVVDPDGVLLESNKLNNKLASTVTFQVNL